MRLSDRHVIEDLGIPGTELMAAAARHIADAARARRKEGAIAAFCGTGNNGGDGIGAAAYLLQEGAAVRVFLIGNPESLTPDSREMLRLLESHGGAVETFDSAHDIVGYLRGCDVIIDAMFGTGLNSDVRGDALLAVEMINESAAYVIAADMPSGVCADTGRILGAAVSADLTVTFSLPKAGQFLEPGCVCAGDLHVCDIGVPQEVLRDLPAYADAVLPDEIALPRRNPNTHKGDYGRCLIIAGSVGYTGAPTLCARAASRCGAGLVAVGVPQRIYDITAAKLDEEMPFPLPDDGSGRLSIAALDAIVSRAAECDAMVIGPGLSRSPGITELVAAVLKLVTIPVILDADGINAISGNIDILDNAAGPVILTPHPGEFMRLGGDLSGGNRLGPAREFAVAHNVITVLKGHRTISAMPDGSAYINTTGGPAMAKGGSGDVLAGMIAALIGQKFPLKDSVLAAVCIHGYAGDKCADEYGVYSPVAGDIINMLPMAAKLFTER